MQRHVFICVHGRSSGRPACGPRGGDALVAAVQRALVVGGGDARVTGCGCLGPCFDGPNAVVYPEGVWLAGLDAGDAEALAAFAAGGPLGALAGKQVAAPGPADDE